MRTRIETGTHILVMVKMKALAKFLNVGKCFPLQLGVFNKTVNVVLVGYICTASSNVTTGLVQETLSQTRNGHLQKEATSWNGTIKRLARSGRIEDARQLFDKIPQRNVFSWNAMIAGYFENQRVDDARELFDRMPDRDVASWTAMIVGYSQNNRIDYARKMFDRMPYRDVVSWNAMIAAYAEHGNIENARQLFDKMPEQNVISWTAMMRGYARQGRTDDARHLFDKMPERDIIAWNAMIVGYIQNGRLEEARQLFDETPKRNVISWTTIIAGCVQNGHSEEALKLFLQMQLSGIKPNQPTFTSVLSACAMLEALEQGKQSHAHIIKTGFDLDTYVASALITLYAKCESIENARLIFDKMSNRNVVTWTAMIAGYVQNVCGEDALKLFCHLKQSGIKPNQSTLTTVLNACSNLETLEQGKEIHDYIIKLGFGLDVYVANALITMYAKCGNIDDAYQVFDKMPEHNLVSWNAMITGYAHHGHGKEALLLFEHMVRAGLMPDQITFIGVLSACSHAGLVEEGWQYFDSMRRCLGIIPRAEHYVCMVDLLGRSGLLDEAEEFIRNLQLEPHVGVWKALLGACSIHANMEVARRAAEHIFELEPQNSAGYVLLCNTYAAAGRWDDAAKVRLLMRDRGVKKSPGCSWIEIKNKVHVFLVGDRSHPQADKIYSMLDNLTNQME